MQRKGFICIEDEEIYRVIFIFISQDENNNNNGNMGKIVNFDSSSQTRIWCSQTVNK